MAREKIQYVTNDDGEQVAVIVPINLWKEMRAERETAYLMSSPAMKKRLLKALKHPRPIKLTLEELREKLGI